MESDPKTVRKCGSPQDVADEGTACSEALEGSNKIILCRCNTTGCNKAGNVASGSVSVVLAGIAALAMTAFGSG